MAEYIEREAALLKLMQDGCLASNIASINGIPAADVVSVVRCKDCKHGMPGWEGIVRCGHPEYDLLEGTLAHGEDHFCAYGERRE